ncbi:hypothetical protein [Algoriphagus confluentis]|uniref:Uncharacterized protein n=1 Tax=Algoriphagus confluentis TaxID=1697556 RepID=A0ABQ6PJD2_9BACT|nr:hypothetical protein Aconfl_02540 [Algoriphagus confluentis]
MKVKFLKPWALVMVFAVALGSCTESVDQKAVLEMNEEIAEPTYEEALGVWQELDLEAGNPFGLRLAGNFNYFETSRNQLFFIPGEGYVGGPAPGFYPGTGRVSASKMGRANSFLNQFAFFEGQELVTVGAPVSSVFGAELLALGIENVPDEVSSLTVDKKGNSIWFKNVKNTVTPISSTLSSFLAEVEIIGGTGRFSKLRGTGVVRGNFNPVNGEGKSVTMAQLKNGK